MKKICLLFALFFFAGISFAQDRNLRLVKPPGDNPTNQQRKAVVIGMSDYGNKERNLPDAANDADDMATVFTRLGFEVTLLKNNDLQTLEKNLDKWYRSIERNDMAIFYFAGHGMKIKGINYLIPVDFPTDGEESNVKYKAYSVEQVLDNMDEKQVAMKLLILDACQDNPYKRSWSRGSSEKGLAEVKAPMGIYVLFSSWPGSTAQEGSRYGLRNGVFTHYLIQEIEKEGVTIDGIINKVAGEVANLTHKQQMPYKSGMLTQDFYFKPPNNKPAPYRPEPEKPAPYKPEPEKPAPNKPTPVNTDAVVINGVCWAKKNVGAFAPEDYGNYYTWEEAKKVCPKGWRLPTKEEFESLINAGSVWTTQNGINGRKFGDNNNFIFLTAAGYLRFSDDRLYSADDNGAYWSSTPNSSEYAYGLDFYNGGASMLSSYRAYGQTVRCVAE